MLAWLERAELSPVVEEDDLASLDVDEHVGLPIAVHVAEGEGHRDEVLPWSDQGRTQVDLGFGGVSPRKLDDLHLTVEVESDEVARVPCRVVVPDHGVTLEGARTPVVQVILGDTPPTDESQHEVPQ